MKTQSLIELLTDKFAQVANVKSIYGDPIEAQGKTIIPVAKIAFGLGAGGAKGEEEDAPGGGGGGLGGVPVGVLEVTEEATRFIPFNDWKAKGKLMAIGAFVGILLYRWIR
jgi:uncharacterized spore protein YtfJ